MYGLTSSPTSSAIGIEHVHPGEATFSRCSECLSFSITKSCTISRFSTSKSYERMPARPRTNMDFNFDSSKPSNWVVSVLASFIMYILDFFFISVRKVFMYISRSFESSPYKLSPTIYPNSWRLKFSLSEYSSLQRAGAIWRNIYIYIKYTDGPILRSPSTVRVV